MLKCMISKGHGDEQGRVVLFFEKAEEALEIELTFAPEEAETLGVKLISMAKKAAADIKGDDNG